MTSNSIFIWKEELMKNSKGLKVILNFQDVTFILLSTVETVIGGYKFGIQ